MRTGSDPRFQRSKRKDRNFSSTIERGTDRNKKKCKTKTDPQTVSGREQRGNEWGIEIDKGLI